MPPSHFESQTGVSAPKVPSLAEQFIDTVEGITLVVDGGLIRGATTLEIQMRGALQDALKALYDARCGLDLGLGCAREIEGDNGPRATNPRSAMQEAHLERARAAWRKVREVLGER